MRGKNFKKRFHWGTMIFGLVLIALAATGCTMSTATVVPTMDMEQAATDVAETVVAAFTSTAAAQPINPEVPTLTSTSLPTETPLPMPTDLPTATPLPTNTPTSQPTATPLPTSTPVVIVVTPVYTATPSVGVKLSTTDVAIGESFTVTVYGFTPNVDIDFRLMEIGISPSLIVDGKTDSTGTAAVTMTMPNVANVGESWEVFVTTTEISPVETATSAAIKIESTSATSGDKKVLLSSISLAPGETFTVSVSGFPASENIDFKLGENGESVSVIADGQTDSSGSAAVLMTIPSSANKNEKWLVTVHTTDLVTQIKQTSDYITITD